MFKACRAADLDSAAPATGRFVKEECYGAATRIKDKGGAAGDSNIGHPAVKIGNCAACDTPAIISRARSSASADRGATGYGGTAAAQRTDLHPSGSARVDANISGGFN